MIGFLNDVLFKDMIFCLGGDFKVGSVFWDC